MNLPKVLEVSSLAVETRALTKRYGDTTAIEDLNLMVPRGSVYLLVGPNGAGKTTTFRVLLGLLRPDEGAAWVANRESGHDGRARARIGYVSETPDIGYDWLRVDHLIEHHARYHLRWDPGYRSHLEELLEIPLDQKLGTLSKGQTQKVQLLLALAHRPPVLLLDEPTDGLDPGARDRVLAALTEHVATSPTTVLVATHRVYELDGLADYVGVLRDGGLVTQLGRDLFRARLQAYAFTVDEDWSPPATLNTVDGGDGTGRHRRWIIWGDTDEVRRELEAAGASVHAVESLSLDGAAVALIKGEIGP